MKYLVLVGGGSSCLDYVLELADPEKDELVLFFVQEEGPSFSLSGSGTTPPDMNGMIRRAKKEGFMCSQILSTGKVTQLLQKNIEDFEIDIVVVGCREVSALRKALFGSVSEFASQNVSCAVLVVKRDSPSSSTS